MHRRTWSATGAWCCATRTILRSSSGRWATRRAWAPTSRPATVGSRSTTLRVRCITNVPCTTGTGPSPTSSAPCTGAMNNARNMLATTPPNRSFSVNMPMPWGILWAASTTIGNWYANIPPIRAVSSGTSSTRGLPATSPTAVCRSSTAAISTTTMRRTTRSTATVSLPPTARGTPMPTRCSASTRAFGLRLSTLRRAGSRSITKISSSGWMPTKWSGSCLPTAVW